MAPLLQFRAGRAERQGDTNTVKPLPGRGLITIEENDGLMCFYYKDLESNAIIDELIIFPGDATFQKAAERVHVLKFNSSSARSFYWHQDVSAENDDERARKLNELIGGQVEEESSAAAQEERMEVEGSASANSSSDPFTTPAPASRVAVPPPTTMPHPARPNAALGSEAQMNQLRDNMAGISKGKGGSAANASTGYSAYNDTPEFLLTEVLSPANANSLVANASEKTLASLSAFLPPGMPQNAHSLQRAIASPEFRRSVASLDRALRTGALGPLVSGLGLPADSAMGVEAFLEAIQKQADAEKAKSGEDSSADSRMETD